MVEYCAPVSHHALPAYLSDELARVQKRALSIISPNDMSYHERLSLCNLETLNDKQIELCNNFSDSILSEPCHKLSHLLPDLNEPRYCLRKQRQFKRPVMRTKRYMNTFNPSMSNRRVSKAYSFIVLRSFSYSLELFCK